jgi:hypothetical protein
MSKHNPFFEDDLIASIARDTESVQSKQAAGLQVLLKTQTPETKLNYKPTFNLSQFMSYNFSHFTKFSFAGLAVFTLLAGGLSAQAFAPDQYKPLTFLQQKELKDFGAVKNQTETKVADNLGVAKNKIISEFCDNFNISHFDVGDGGSGRFSYNLNVSSGESAATRLNFYSNQFFITCRNQETRKVYGDSDRPIFNKIDLDSEICPSDYKGLPAGLSGVGGICLEAYNISQSDVKEIPFITDLVKNTIKSDVKKLTRTYRERELRSEDNTYIFADNKGNDFELTVKNGNVFTDKYNLQIDLK